MAAAGWARRPGLDRLRSQGQDTDVHSSTLKALRDLADAIPGYMAGLQTKEKLVAQQRVLNQSRGSVEQIGMSTEQVQLRVAERVGEGTFCVVFRGELLSSPSTESVGKAVAAKFELRKTDATQLRNEFRMYKRLEMCAGIPRIYTFGEMDLHKVLVMDLLGPSLESLFQDCGRRFSLTTVAMLALQMITRIETLHQRSLIYRDIKPENFLMGLPGTASANQVHLIDYGMAKVYRDPDTNQHIPYSDAHSLSGTARYMSINAHCRRNQSRRDDLEALGHVFLYFARGNLPWQTVKTPANEGGYDSMCEKKQATTIDDLCRDLPPELAQYLTYTRGLTFEQDPDYEYLRGLFTKILDDNGAAADGDFDWMQKKPTVSDASTENAAEPASVASPEQPPRTSAMLTAQPAKVIDATTDRPTTPPQLVIGAGGADHRAMIVVPPPASPQSGKRRRSEFASDLKPPVRSIRAKKPAHIFYDSEAQRILAALYRDVMAGRYNFYRAVKQRQARGGLGASLAASASATAAGGALSTQKIPAPGLYRRSTARASASAEAIAPAFTQVLDTTLGQVMSELEEMSDKLLQDGDWSGAARVRDWFEQVLTSIKEETERLEQEQAQEKQQKQTQGVAASPVSPASAIDSCGSEPAQGKRESSLPAAISAAPHMLGETEINTAATAPRSPPSSQANLFVQGNATSWKQQSSFQIATLISADPLEVDDGQDEEEDERERLDEAVLRARYSTRPITGAFMFPRKMQSGPRVPATLPPPSSPSSPLSSAPASKSPSPATVANPPRLSTRTSDPFVAASPAPLSIKPYALGSPSAAVRSGLGYLSLESDDPILAADDDEDDVDKVVEDDADKTKTAKQGSDDKLGADDINDGTDILELVYRTASGMRRVVCVANQGRDANGHGGRPQ
ncbi:hypothetical protein SEPCBS57363_000319 [Sporothrix epigloea]|uniref:non-specific serine/threonine protein kinase n=1 Tax=Sporothrix epigloea TaxID=1892477 RepID=A0ABP0D414_9PEZI